jgi:hypothetical protein
VADGLQKEGFELSGFDGVLQGTVPLGSGLSSSAALECATATVFEALGDWKLDPVQKARLCQRAENQFVGVRCVYTSDIATERLTRAPRLRSGGEIFIRVHAHRPGKARHQALGLGPGFAAISCMRSGVCGLGDTLSPALSQTAFGQMGHARSLRLRLGSLPAPMSAATSKPKN